MELIPTDDGYFYIQSILGNYLDVQWGNSYPGALVHMWSFNGGRAQKWKLIKIGGRDTQLDGNDAISNIFSNRNKQLWSNILKKKQDQSSITIRKMKN